MLIPMAAKESDSLLASAMGVMMKDSAGLYREKSKNSGLCDLCKFLLCEYLKKGRNYRVI